MPLNVRRFCTSIFLGSFFLIGAVVAQTEPVAQSPVSTVPTRTPTSAEVMRERISKAKAFIAVRNYNAAIYELENIRRETSDPSVRSVTNVLLMNSYLEQGDYKRAQDFLTEYYNEQKTNTPNSNENFAIIAGQVIKGARNQIERYQTLGLSVSDRNLPLEAVNDIEKMRETLELVVTQSKEMSKDKARSAGAMALLEQATNTRSSLARDEYDARRWRDEIADSREQLANAGSVIKNAVDGTPVTDASAMTNAVQTENTASTPPSSETKPANFTPVQEIKPKQTENVIAAKDKPAEPEVKKIEPEAAKPITVQTARKEEPKKQEQQPAETAKAAPPKDDSPLQMGSLVEYATNRTAPAYPSAARSMRASGMVRVDVLIDESGEVSEVQKTSGPSLLQAAARDAVRKWKFKPFTRDGQPVKALGFVNFNFTL